MYLFLEIVMSCWMHLARGFGSRQGAIARPWHGEQRNPERQCQVWRLRSITERMPSVMNLEKGVDMAAESCTDKYTCTILSAFWFPAHG